tara:strand:- start:123 stop:503 length:381 start_codon:yes stop_codon:yes gene_type:complete
MALTNLTKGTVVDSESGSATTNLVQGLAKCFAFFDQRTGNVLRDSFNTSSVSDEGAGDARWNITNAMSSVYSNLSGTTARSGTHGLSGGGGNMMLSTSQWRVVTSESESQTTEDAEWSATGHGDLA